MRCYVGLCVLAAVFAASAPSYAASPSAADRAHAMGTALTSEMQALVEATAQVFADEREITALKAQIAAANAHQEPAAPKSK